MEEQFVMNNKHLDQEWVDLILAAMDMGMTVQEIKAFFSKNELEVEII